MRFGQLGLGMQHAPTKIVGATSAPVALTG